MTWWVEGIRPILKHTTFSAPQDSGLPEGPKQKKPQKD